VTERTLKSKLNEKWKKERIEKRKRKERTIKLYKCRGGRILEDMWE
jgi:hypothetical protein